MDHLIKISIFRINIHDIDYQIILQNIEYSITQRKKCLITYVTAHSLNNVYNNKRLINVYNSFSIVHSDGIGTFLASKLLFGKFGLSKRITGSDLYPILINKAIEKDWKLFFWGDRIENYQRIVLRHPQLMVSGFISGFNFNEDSLISEINQSNSDILIIGLGTSKQEEWIINNNSKLNTPIIIAVGDGIKIFAGIKHRGWRIIRIIGLEWLVRLIYNPLRYWKRYIIDGPSFIFKIINEKIRM